MKKLEKLWGRFEAMMNDHFGTEMMWLEPHVVLDTEVNGCNIEIYAVMANGYAYVIINEEQRELFLPDVITDEDDIETLYDVLNDLEY